MGSAIPVELKPYLGDLVEQLKSCLADELIGVYLFGSASYDAYEHERSDVDVQAVVIRPLGTQEKQQVVRRLNHRALPCPARKLEFVIYAAGNVTPAKRHPIFELNFNTGPSEDDHVSLDPAHESSHWFLLDIAMGRRNGRALFGPTATEVFAPIPRRWVLEAIADSLEWHKANELTSVNSVLNACRSWQFVATDHFGSKLAGAEWALTQNDCPIVVKHAINARDSGESLSPDQVSEIFNLVAKANDVALLDYVDE
ncbi:Spectinomycin 9-adenylyltransferase [Paramyrothecium foliicola]|nr:Spectinomycin 9-adenylyltransferase [Paramyrothecium foliicola]